MPPKFPLLLVACILAESSFAQNRAGDFRLIRISRDFMTSPEYSYEGAEQQHTSQNKWLRVEVQFSAAPDFTDELTFKYYILIKGKVLTSEVTHVNILAGRDLYSVMYMPPHALAYVLQSRAPNTTSIANIAVQIVQKGEVKDELSLFRARPGWFASLPTLSGFLLNKSETPFAPLFWDHYEQIKTASR